MKIWEGLNRLELVEKMVKAGNYYTVVTFTPTVVEEPEPTPPIIIGDAAYMKRIGPIKPCTQEFMGKLDSLLNEMKSWKL